VLYQWPVILFTYFTYGNVLRKAHLVSQVILENNANIKPQIGQVIFAQVDAI
jgi:hypothetical protein